MLVKRFFLNNILLSAIDILVLLICIGGFYFITSKADLPFKTSIINSNLVVSEILTFPSKIKTGDIVNRLDNFQFDYWEEIELYLDGKQIGQEVLINIHRDGIEIPVKVTLINYYSIFDRLTIGIIGLIFFVFAILVRLKAPENSSAQIFHLASLGLAIVIISTAGNYSVSSFGYANRILWLFAYCFTPVLFIHFTSSFAQKKIKNIKIILRFFYLSAVISAAILSYFFLRATVSIDIVFLKYYVFFFNSIFRLFFIMSVVVAISICIYGYMHATNREERKKLQWLLLGFFIGPFSFVLFWVLPIFFIGHSLLPEALVLIFLTAIPITFSIAIIKYQLMDINLLVRRSLVYSIIMVVIILTYIGISSLITLFINDINPAFPSVLTAIVVVLALQPVKSVIQKFVDKKFFRIEYNFREEQNRFLDAIKNVYDVKSLSELIVDRADKLIPVEKIGFFELDNRTYRIKIIAEKGWEMLRGRSIRFEFENLKTDLSKPIVVDDKIEPGLKVESADIKVFKRWGMVLVFPVKSPTKIIHGFLVLGVKKSGMRFLKDDIDLLNSVVFAAALAIDRIKLQEELILEQLEAERLEEMNRLKSFFMQTITHELKTPLTSIKMFTQKLQDRKGTQNEKADFYLSVIDGESDKLRRLIDNILDYAKIEKGMKSYILKCNNLMQISEKAVESMKYLYMMNKQSVDLVLPSEEIIVHADEEAIERAITNLLTNAIKYSEPGSKTVVSVKKNNNTANVEIKDSGRGIQSSELENIFEPFSRAKSVEEKKIEGTGLGLAIVKHIMEAHNGKIFVESELGKGSKFTLSFPLANE